MALLAQPKRKEKYGFDPRNTKWASDDNKFGQKLMEKMGWEKGKGLGANEDGIVEHIKASYKSDTRGLGCSPRDADAWIAHQDDFNDLLRVLNENSSKDPEKVNSSKEDSQEGRKRFYGRFARGRVQILRRTDDLDCIMGRRKTSEPSTPVVQSDNTSDDEEKDTNLKTINSTLSVQEYFAKKMKDLKSRKGTSHGVDGEPKALSPTSLKTPAEGTTCSETKPVYGAVCFSYNDEEKPTSAGIDMSKEKGWYEGEEWLVTDKEKEKKKGRTSVTENALDCEDGDSNQITKRKKKKLKTETVSWEKLEASLNERSSQSDDNNDANQNESRLCSFLSEVEDSTKRKKIRSKSKEYDVSESFEEVDSKEMNKRKKRKLKLDNNLSDKCQTSEGEIPLPLESKKKETTDNTEVGESILKKKRKRKGVEVSDTSQYCSHEKVEDSQEYSVSPETEGTKSKNSRKRRKGKGDDSCSEDAEKKLKKKRKKEAKSRQDFSDIKVKQKRKLKKESAQCTNKTPEENKSTESKTDNALAENFEEQAKLRKSKKKKKKTVNVETAEMEDSLQKSVSNLEPDLKRNESNDSVVDYKVVEKEKDTHNDAGMKIEGKQDFSDIKVKQKRKSKKESVQLTNKTSEENKSTKNKTGNVLSGNIEEQAEISKSKKKNKKMVNIETAEIEHSERESVSNLECDPEIRKSNDSFVDGTVAEPEKVTHNNTGMNIEGKQASDVGKLKKKRQEKKKRRQLKKYLSDSFPGSNFGELKGYVPMIS